MTFQIKVAIIMEFVQTFQQSQPLVTWKNNDSFHHNFSIPSYNMHAATNDRCAHFLFVVQQV